MGNGRCLRNKTQNPTPDRVSRGGDILLTPVPLLSVSRLYARLASRSVGRSGYSVYSK